MTKLQDLILLAHSDPSYQDRPGDISIFGLESIMKEYAEWYAKLALEQAAEQATIGFEHTEKGDAMWLHVSKLSIINAKLPDHI